jgi:hypothetical protein
MAQPVASNHSRSIARKEKTFWSMISGTPPVVIGAAGAVIMAVEGRILGVLLVLLLVFLHHFAGSLLTRRYLTIDQTADWTAICVLTTVVCYALPFYLAISMG